MLTRGFEARHVERGPALRCRRGRSAAFASRFTFEDSRDGPRVRIQACVSEAYSFEIKGTAPSEIDWRPMIVEIVEDMRGGIRARRHCREVSQRVVEIIVMWRGMSGRRGVLTRAVFQNRYLTERSVHACSRRIPPR